MEPMPLFLPETLAADVFSGDSLKLLYTLDLKTLPFKLLQVSYHSLPSYVRTNKLSVNDFILELGWIYILLAVLKEVIK